MTSHYIKTFGVAKCREILKGMPEGASQWGENIDNPIYYKFENNLWWFFSESLGDWATSSINYGDEDIEQTLIKLSDLRAELSLHDTDSCTDILNHISPNTVVVG